MMETIEFKPMQKIARLSRLCIITEKIDGTNASIFIGIDREFKTASRTQWITPFNDNFGFSAWAHEHKDELMEALGPGHHFGEWWGSGIQRGYGLPKGERRFSLFNTLRWCNHDAEPRPIPNGNPKAEVKYQQRVPSFMSVVPVLALGEFCTGEALVVLDMLKSMGSQAAPGFMNPEGIVLFHVAGNVLFKKTLEKDHEPKGCANADR